MIFVIDNLKYDTDKMELIFEKCEYSCTWTPVFMTTPLTGIRHNVKLWKSKKGNWLVTYNKQGLSCNFAEVLTEDRVKQLLIKYDLSKYEEIFGEVEEA